MARTQLNMRVGTDHIKRLDEMRAAGGLSQSDMTMRLIDDAYARRYKYGELYAAHHRIDTGLGEQIGQMNRYQLDELIEAARIAMMEHFCRDLRQRGIEATTQRPDYRLRYAVVYAPDDGDLSVPPSMFADEGELRHLLDFVANLEPAEAYRRWAPTVRLPAADTFWRHGQWRTEGRIRRELEQARKELAEAQVAGDASRIDDLENAVSELEWLLEHDMLT